MDVERTVYREDHEMFRTAVRRFLEREYLPHQAQWAASGTVDRRVWLKAGREGLLCVTLPAEFGGGGDFGHAAVLSEEFARAGICDRALSVHSDTIAPSLALLGNDEQKCRWLPAICSGEAILALAVSEAHSPLNTIPTYAVREGDHYRINGSKFCTGNGPDCDLVLLACHVQGDEAAAGVSLILVETERHGLSWACLQAGSEQPATTQLRLTDVRVPVANLLGESGKGLDYLNQAWNREHLLSAVFAASQLERLLERTLAQVPQPACNAPARWDEESNSLILARVKARAIALRLMVDHFLDRRMSQLLSAEHVTLARLFANETLSICTRELARLYSDDNTRPNPLCA
ncbi:pimeloyl-CoA dehydrogenase, large subunit [compost metagenome]